MSRKTVYQAQTKNSNSLSKPYRQWKGKSVYKFYSRSPLLIWCRRCHDNCQQKNRGIQRKDLMAVPAAMPASSPKAMFSIIPSNGSLWTITWWEPERQTWRASVFCLFLIFFFNNTYIKKKQSLWCLHGVNWDQIKSQRGGCPWWLYNAISWLYRDRTKR